MTFVKYLAFDLGCQGHRNGKGLTPPPSPDAAESDEGHDTTKEDCQRNRNCGTLDGKCDKVAFADTITVLAFLHTLNENGMPNQYFQVTGSRETLSFVTRDSVALSRKILRYFAQEHMQKGGYGATYA
jgi:hypothetical protein